ncbi:MAG: hypothetical protein H0V18_15455 [Pyrinomonadaceae bacterium]|jgi:hypothetical protein|nr:hypothetical protein [Pyrinomonadaceae bacterium]
MKGIVIHHNGKIWRALEGRVNIGRLAIQAITPVPWKQEGTNREYSRRPVYFIFRVGDRIIAAAKNVTLRKGRRYPNIEHWFVPSELNQHLDLNELQQVSAASALA